MSYFAAAFARSGGDWLGSEIDLDDVETVEEVAGAASQVESDGGLVIVLVEEEDWFGVIRVEPDDEPRVYVSDAAETVRSVIGTALLSELAEEYAQVGEEDEDEAAPPVLPAEPLGEPGVLDDLGVSADELNRLAAAIGTSPADAVTAIAERLGCVDALEAVR